MAKNDALKKRLFQKPKSSWDTLPNNKVMGFSEGYKQFLDTCKTERLAVKHIEKQFKMNGISYYSFKNKVVFGYVLGKKKDKLRIVASHTDSPRLDLKPSPLVEDSFLGLLKTHYYGGIKKYQWVNTPMALIGVAYTKSGKKIEISIGDKESDPKFIIPDLLPHLSRDQMERKASKIVEGEELKIYVGNIPYGEEKEEDRIRLAVIKKLYDDYGLVEEDFNIAELEIVPSAKAMDIGIDRSMIASYAQDDRACVYTSLKALLETKNPDHTAVTVFFDKEEVGSAGDTGATSFMLKNFVSRYIKDNDIKKTTDELLENAKAISADVTAAIDPNFKDAYDPKNSSYLGCGVSVEKYGGAGGKYHTNDTHAEYFQEIRALMNKEKVPWQTGELGKIDHGGGGTIGMFLSRYGMDCIDAGPCVLGMHSPCEITSKADIYAAYLLYKVFLKPKNK